MGLYFSRHILKGVVKTISISPYCHCQWRPSSTSFFPFFPCPDYQWSILNAFQHNWWLFCCTPGNFQKVGLCLVSVYTHTHTRTHSSRRSRKSHGGDKVRDSSFGKILRGQLRVCLFLDYSDSAVRKNRLCLSGSMPPSSEARKGIAPIVTVMLWGPPGSLSPRLLLGAAEGLPPRSALPCWGWGRGWSPAGHWTSAERAGLPEEGVLPLGAEITCPQWPMQGALGPGHRGHHV